jgi:hypothetical protein
MTSSDAIHPLHYVVIDLAVDFIIRWVTAEELAAFPLNLKTLELLHGRFGFGR